MTSAILNASSLFSLIDSCGVFSGAIAGALEAKRDEASEFDVVGVLGLGLVSALGGGIIRDVILKNSPPLALTNERYLLIGLGGALLGLYCGTSIGKRLRGFLNPIDSAALGLFAIAGSVRATDCGLSFVPAVLMGMITAVGGGALRDVLSGRTPKVFERGEPFALAAGLVSILFLALREWMHDTKWSTAFGIGLGFLVRMLALRFQWRTPAIR